MVKVCHMESEVNMKVLIVEDNKTLQADMKKELSKHFEIET